LGGGPGIENRKIPTVGTSIKVLGAVIGGAEAHSAFSGPSGQGGGHSFGRGGRATFGAGKKLFGGGPKPSEAFLAAAFSGRRTLTGQKRGKGKKKRPFEFSTPVSPRAFFSLVPGKGGSSLGLRATGVVLGLSPSNKTAFRGRVEGWGPGPRGVLAGKPKDFGEGLGPDFFGRALRKGAGKFWGVCLTTGGETSSIVTQIYLGLGGARWRSLGKKTRGGPRGPWVKRGGGAGGQGFFSKTKKVDWGVFPSGTVRGAVDAPLFSRCTGKIAQGWKVGPVFVCSLLVDCCWAPFSSRESKGGGARAGTRDESCGGPVFVW